jgi:hypothetical protein
MSAPLPLRFYNPIKGLCEKANLDYETVIGTGLSAKMREAYVLADIPKELSEIDKKDRKNVQHKVDFLNRKYGTGGDLSKGDSTTGEVEDKGRSRYDAGIVVESICADDLPLGKPEFIRYGLENSKPIPYKRKEGAWIPGKGVELGLD